MCLRTEQLSKLVTERGTTFFIIQVDFTNKQRKEAEIIHMIINWSWTSVRIHVQFDTDTEEYKKKYRNDGKSCTFSLLCVCPDVSPKTMGLLMRIFFSFYAVK